MCDNHEPANECNRWAKITSNFTVNWCEKRKTWNRCLYSKKTGALSFIMKIDEEMKKYYRKGKLNK